MQLVVILIPNRKREILRNFFTVPNIRPLKLRAVHHIADEFLRARRSPCFGEVREAEFVRARANRFRQDAFQRVP